MVNIVCEILWITYILRDLQVLVVLPIQLHYGNNAAIHIVLSPVFYKHTKHIDIDYHIIKEWLQQGFINTKHLSTQDQLADLFTSPCLHKDINFYLAS